MSPYAPLFNLAGCAWHVNNVQAFLEAAKAAGFDMTHVPAPAGPSGGSNQASLIAVVGQNEYFHVLLPDGSRLVKTILHGKRASQVGGKLWGMV